MTLPAIVRLRNYRDYAEPGTGLVWLEHTAPKNKVFVAIVLGTELKDGSDPLPLLAFIRDLVIDGEAVVPEATETAP